MNEQIKVRSSYEWVLIYAAQFQCTPFHYLTEEVAWDSVTAQKFLDRNTPTAEVKQ